jgi:hypothetical protein
MKATNWYRRSTTNTTHTGDVHVSASRHGKAEPEVHLTLLGRQPGSDLPDRLRAELTLDEARKLQDALGRMIQWGENLIAAEVK